MSGPEDASKESPYSKKYRIIFIDMREKFNEFKRSGDGHSLPDEKVIAKRDQTIVELKIWIKKPNFMKMHSDVKLIPMLWNAMEC